MRAIRQTYEDAPSMIPIPYMFQHNRLEVILLLQEDTEATFESVSVDRTADTVAGCEEAFFLLAGLSDDFMVEGRQQLPLQERDSL
ncbi:conserved hypothetical protein [Gammaproteobacteria bacterium]